MIVRIPCIEHVGIGEAVVYPEVGHFLSLHVRNITVFLSGERIAGRKRLNTCGVNIEIFASSEIVGLAAFDRTADGCTTSKQAVGRGNRRLRVS